MKIVGLDLIRVSWSSSVVVHYESIKRELKIRKMIKRMLGLVHGFSLGLFSKPNFSVLFINFSQILWGRGLSQKVKFHRFARIIHTEM